MSSEGPPPVFNGEDFPYWKIRMETYLEAIDENVYTAAVVGFPKIVKKDAPTSAEQQYDKFNAKARNILFRGLGKDVFNRVRTLDSAHEIWEEVCSMHLGNSEERELRYDLVTKKINSLSMRPNERANDMYSRLNVLVEELNGLGLTQMTKPDVARKIIGLLPESDRVL